MTLKEQRNNFPLCLLAWSTGAQNTAKISNISTKNIATIWREYSNLMKGYHQLCKVPLENFLLLLRKIVHATNFHRFSNVWSVWITPQDYKHRTSLPQLFYQLTTHMTFHWLTFAKTTSVKDIGVKGALLESAQSDNHFCKLCKHWAKCIHISDSSLYS